MAAPMKLTLSKSNFIYRNSRTIFTQTVLSKYNRGSKRDKKRKRFPLDYSIRFGKHENDTYEVGMELADRFVDPAITKVTKPHPEKARKGMYEAIHPYGTVFEKRPFPMILEAGKRYLWCACGRSNRQPICDGSHKLVNRLYEKTSSTENEIMSPMIFEVEESGEYWLCNCKQSKNRPFCDGTHRKLEERDKAVKRTSH